MQNQKETGSITAIPAITKQDVGKNPKSMGIVIGKPDGIAYW
jgi:hypothetical protein